MTARTLSSMLAGLTLVLGGVRSGKSAFAEGLAGGTTGTVLYVATGQATDDEMAERIRRHRVRRPAHWQTVEEPLAPGAALSEVMRAGSPCAAVLVDSLDVWLANLLLAHETEDLPAIEALAVDELDILLAAGREAAIPSILVSSEVGLSPVPPNRLGRHFQDLLGAVNQRVAAAADTVYLVVAGLPLKVKPR